MSIDGSKITASKISASLISGGNIGVPYTSTDIANYPFTANLLDRVNGYSATYSSLPATGSEGVVLVAATDLELQTTGWILNEYQISFTVKYNAEPPSTAMLVDNKSAANNFIYTTSPTRPRWAMAAEAIILPTCGLMDGRTFTYTATKNATDGMIFSVVEIGGSASKSRTSW